MSERRLVAVVGPTASGKTEVAVRLAGHYGAPILSADSRQFYRGMRIGTAQPSDEQLQTAEHHFIAYRDIACHLNCGAYEREALELLEKIFERTDTVLLVGGSGLYVQALCEGMDALPEADEALRAELAAQLETEGLPALAARLQALDPAYAAEADLRNPARVMRALEVCLSTGQPYSSFRKSAAGPRPFSVTKIGLDLPRDVLYERIDRRVDQMLAAGLEEEARALYPFQHLTALRTVGYRELFAYFDGRIPFDEAVRLIKRNTRRYAKRQLTWFRRDPAIRWFAPDQTDAMIRWVDLGES